MQKRIQNVWYVCSLLAALFLLKKVHRIKILANALIPAWIDTQNRALSNILILFVGQYI